MSNPGKLYSIASVFFGIVSIATSMIFFISFPAGVLAIFFGILAVKRYYRKSGTVAIVSGTLGILITIAIFAVIVSKLNVDSIVAGKWNAETGERIEFSDRGAYVYYPDNLNIDEYASGYYKLSSGLYKNGRKYTMGYTVVLNQMKYSTKENGMENLPFTDTWLLYTPNKDVSDIKSDNYEMMNLKTGRIIKITKEKEKIFGIFSI